MKSWQRGITINGNKFTFSELLAFSYDKIESVNTLHWETEIYRFIITWLSDVDEIVQYSSGTTGKSKEIRLLKQSMIASAMGTCRFFNLQKGQTALLCLPATYIAGKMMIVRCMVGELNLCLAEPNGMPDLSDIQHIDFCAMVPLQVLNILNGRNNMLPIKKLIIGGADTGPELENRLFHISTEVYATYGMAETCSHVAIRRLSGTDHKEAYHALSGVTLTQDERGCLVIDATWLPGQVITNDLVEFTGPGSFKWLGRYDNLINSGSIKIVPEEVESIIMAGTTLECAVIGLPDKKLGQKLVLVLEEDKTPIALSTLKSCLEIVLPRHLRPKDIIQVKKFPRNSSFKIDRKKLVSRLIIKPT
jgi:O-succinylbenzoic acid--CoA ligase